MDSREVLTTVTVSNCEYRDGKDQLICCSHTEGPMITPTAPTLFPIPVKPAVNTRIAPSAAHIQSNVCNLSRTCSHTQATYSLVQAALSSAKCSVSTMARRFNIAAALAVILLPCAFALKVPDGLRHDLLEVGAACMLLITQQPAAYHCPLLNLIPTVPGALRD